MDFFWAAEYAEWSRLLEFDLFYLSIYFLSNYWTLLLPNYIESVLRSGFDGMK